MVVKTTGVVKYDLTREYLVGTNSGTENNVSQNGNTVCPKGEIQYRALTQISHCENCYNAVQRLITCIRWNAPNFTDFRNGNLAHGRILH